MRGFYEPLFKLWSIMMCVCVCVCVCVCDSAVLQSEPLQRLFINKLREVCLAWQKQLPSPGSSSSRTHSCSVHAIRNTRRKMEDRHIILKEFNQLLGLQVRPPQLKPCIVVGMHGYIFNQPHSRIYIFLFDVFIDFSAMNNWF